MHTVAQKSMWMLETHLKKCVWNVWINVLKRFQAIYFTKLMFANAAWFEISLPNPIKCDLSVQIYYGAALLI